MKYIGYFELRKNGELEDDWSEWCTASSKEEAIRYFLENRHPNIILTQVIESK